MKASASVGVAADTIDVRENDMDKFQILDGLGQEMTWQDIVNLVVARARQQLLPRQWLVATETRRIQPAEGEGNSDEWRRWLFHYLLEDELRHTPHFPTSERERLIDHALGVLATLVPGDAAIACLQAESWRRSGCAIDRRNPPDPIKRLLEADPTDESSLFFWLTLSDTTDYALATSICADLVETHPQSWWLKLRLARYLEAVDLQTTRQLRLDASRILKLQAQAHQMSPAGGFDLWEIIIGNTTAVWACERPSPSRFCLQNEQLVLSWDCSESPRTLVVLPER